MSNKRDLDPAEFAFVIIAFIFADGDCIMGFEIFYEYVDYFEKFFKKEAAAPPEAAESKTAILGVVDKLDPAMVLE